MSDALARSTELFRFHDWEEMDLEAMRLDAMLESGEFIIRTASDPAEVETEWRALETNAFGTLFTTYDWLSSWYRLVGRPRGAGGGHASEGQRVPLRCTRGGCFREGADRGRGE